MDKSNTNKVDDQPAVNKPGAVANDVQNARTEAANDIDSDPDTHGEPSVDDLDEGELARKDNSND
ncbi:MAG: hypothetical protein EOO05_00700 [Chitinophagaceae bacterium]|nr:MAG: hypothetical protein EOO05_00700 [Chitinophagaceae bacterium]